jgi:hypothetical protein
MREALMNKNLKTSSLVSRNRNLARKLWGDSLDPLQWRSLTELTQSFWFSLAMGDMMLLQNRWYVTHTGLIRLAQRHHCAGVNVEIINQFCDPNAARWSFKATVYKSRNSRGFVGYGDADPSNVSSLVHGAEMRVAETRAVNRALRKAYGIGLCSVEELGRPHGCPGNGKSNQSLPPAAGSNGRQNGQLRLRDRLCLLIRQHRLDASLVKAYAADYCGTATLRDASREQVEAFINHLTERASNDREALLCHLNSYPRPQESE